MAANDADRDRYDEIHLKFGWPQEISVIEVISSLDGTKQPSLYYSPTLPNGSSSSTGIPNETSSKRPLLIALHTWSFDYRQGGGQIVFAKWCMEQNWHFLHPNFRGPNDQPEACGSDLAVQDILDAVEYVKQQSANNVNEDRIYVVGVSGGGHMSLMLASRYPKLWAGVSAWSGISDLREWWRERSAETSDCIHHAAFRKYATNVEHVVGGTPTDGSPAAAMEECWKRSPVTYLSELSATDVSLDINHGIADGREGGSVPFWHSLQAFDAVQTSQDQRGDQWMRQFYDSRQVPPLVVQHDSTREGEELSNVSDPLYQERPIHYRRTKDSTRLTIFEGGHEILHLAALNWLSQQRRGQPSVWEIPDDVVHYMDVDKALAESGK